MLDVDRSVEGGVGRVGSYEKIRLADPSVDVARQAAADDQSCTASHSLARDGLPFFSSRPADDDRACVAGE